MECGWSWQSAPRAPDRSRPWEGCWLSWRPSRRSLLAWTASPGAGGGPRGRSRPHPGPTVRVPQCTGAPLGGLRSASLSVRSCRHQDALEQRREHGPSTCVSGKATTKPGDRDQMGPGGKRFMCSKREHGAAVRHAAFPKGTHGTDTALGPEHRAAGVRGRPWPALQTGPCEGPRFP